MQGGFASDLKDKSGFLIPTHTHRHRQTCLLWVVQGLHVRDFSNYISLGYFQIQRAVLKKMKKFSVVRNSKS